MKILAIRSDADFVATHTFVSAAITRISSLDMGSSSSRTLRIPSSMNLEWQVAVELAR